MNKLMMPTEVAQKLGFNIRKIYRLSQKGCFMCCKIRGSLRICSQSVEHYIKCKESGIDPPLYKYRRNE
jgi:hypothetical protein